MRLLKPFSGNSRPLKPPFHALAISMLFYFVLSLLSAPSAQAMHEDFENENYKRPALVATGAVSGIYLVSRLNDSPIFFGAIFGMTSLYLMNEWYRNEEEWLNLIVPFATLTLSLINFTLLNNDDEYSKHDVFLYNTIGVGAILMYATVEHARHHGHFSEFEKSRRKKREENYGRVLPIIGANEYSAVWQKNF